VFVGEQQQTVWQRLKQDHDRIVQLQQGAATMQGQMDEWEQQVRALQELEDPSEAQQSSLEELQACLEEAGVHREALLQQAAQLNASYQAELVQQQTPELTDRVVLWMLPTLPHLVQSVGFGRVKLQQVQALAEALVVLPEEHVNTRVAAMLLLVMLLQMADPGVHAAFLGTPQWQQVLVALLQLSSIPETTVAWHLLDGSPATAIQSFLGLQQPPKGTLVIGAHMTACFLGGLTMQLLPHVLGGQQQQQVGAGAAGAAGAGVAVPIAAAAAAGPLPRLVKGALRFPDGEILQGV
jgi:hypothetical protein